MRQVDASTDYVAFRTVAWSVAEMSQFCLREGQDRRQLLIAFEMTQEASGQQVFAQLTNHASYSVLLVDSLNHRLRSAALDDILDTLPDTVKQIRSYVHEIEPLSLGTIGSSFSGWIALHCGGLLNADVCIAFGPDTFVGDPGSRSAKFVRAEALRFAAPDIRKTYLEHSPAAAHIYFGEDDAIDVAAAWRLSDLPGVHVHGLKNTGHNVYHGLARTGFVRRMVGSLFDPDFDFADFPGRGRLTEDHEPVLSLISGREHYANRRYQEAIRDLERAHRYFSTNSTLIYELGISYYRLNQYTDAIRKLEGVVHEASCPAKVLEIYGSAVEKVGVAPSAMVPVEART